ncbi:ABC-type branched-chain amino acid transport system protein [Paramagnetospirillum caucaseum]|uniref:ABC-type branched-chain amino acid transport system protein n=1 Tax=Paramagnetospirillum caucaseum TaxID=1244869 RepID=M2Z1U1_9PROT|nr:ABC transporter substrate-binding protein [Paramagnetospirillum caucaseum]EME68260.1 ABC-type branched-chain amino acid transport system protein [Paramagnetospirillum caucaseum]
MNWKRTAGAALAVMTSVCAATTAMAAEPIKIGMFLSVTGQMSPMGDPQKRTFDYMIDKLNAQGGVLGRKIEAIIYDDGSEPEKAATFVKRLIDNDKVDIIIGGSGTPTSMAVLGLIERAEIPYMSLGGGTAIGDPVRKWTFKFPQSDRLAAEKVLADLKKRGLTKIALLSENVGFGKSGHDQTVKLAPQYGVEILIDEVYSPKDPDVTPQLTKIRGMAGVQALFIFGTGTGPAVATKNLKQMGLTLPVYQSHGVASKEFLRLVGTAADGTRLPAGAQAVAEQLSPSDRQKKIVMDFKKEYEERNKPLEVSPLPGHGLDALMMAMDAFKRAGSTEKAKVRDAIEQTKDFVATTGIYTYSPTDHMGLGLESFKMVEIKNGDWVLIE